MTNPIIPSEGVLLGRARLPGFDYPRVVTVRGTDLVDITSKTAPLVRDITEMADPAGYVASAEGDVVGSVHLVLANSWSGKSDRKCAGAAVADRPAGGEGGRRDVRRVAARAGDRGAGAWRQGQGRRCCARTSWG